jgi:hypothetical protein
MSQPYAYEYKVVTFRESLIGDALDSDKLEKVLNKHAEDGWGLKAITSADVKAASARARSRACCSPSNGRASNVAVLRRPGALPPRRCLMTRLCLASRVPAPGPGTLATPMSNSCRETGGLTAPSHHGRVGRLLPCGIDGVLGIGVCRCAARTLGVQRHTHRQEFGARSRNCPRLALAVGRSGRVEPPTRQRTS